MEMTPDKKKKITWWIIGIAAACILIFLCAQNINAVVDTLSRAIDLITPLLVGCAFALVINVPMRFIESHLWPKAKKKFFCKLRRPLAYIISLILIIAILFGVVMIVIPELVEAVKVIVQEVIDLVKRLSTMSEAEFTELPLGNVLLNIEWDELLTQMQGWLKNQGSNLLGTAVDTAVGTIGSLVGGLFDLFVALAFSIYVLFSKETLKHQGCRLIRAWLSRNFGEWFIHAGSVLSGNFRNFISGQTLEALILGTLCMIGMWILRFPYAPMVGALVGVTALIPVVGAFVGAGVGAFLILTVEPVKAFGFLLFVIILQQLEGNLIYPKVMGSRVNLPAMWILAAVTIGGSLSGPVGMLLSVPLASTMYILLREATEKREKDLSSPSNKNL